MDAFEKAIRQYALARRTYALRENLARSGNEQLPETDEQTAQRERKLLRDSGRTVLYTRDDVTATTRASNARAHQSFCHTFSTKSAAEDQDYFARKLCDVVADLGNTAPGPILTGAIDMVVELEAAGRWLMSKKAAFPEALFETYHSALEERIAIMTEATPTRNSKGYD